MLYGRDPTYRGGFWILADAGDGIKSVSLELLGKAHELAAFLGASRSPPCCPAPRGHLPAELIATGRTPST